MTDPILDDVQALLDKELGDKRILDQILRAAQNDEVISNFERNYVRKLAEKHLGKKPPLEKKPTEKPKEIVPDIIPTPSPKPQTIQSLKEPPKITKSRSKNNKIMLGIGIAALALIITAAASLSGTTDISPSTNLNPSSSTPQPFSITTDLASYNRGDIISISGNSEGSITQVNLSITNSENEIVWSEEVNVRANGQFSTLTFAGGPSWGDSDTYTLTAESDTEQAVSTFTIQG
jgi:outer membrane biosynthesis protein TonB